MKKPLIAISTSSKISNYQEVTDLPSAYSQAVSQVGGLPFLIPNTFPLDGISSLCDHVDGILLSGGGDIDISLFNGKADSNIGTPDKNRDAIEIALIKEAVKRELPVFGICRGIQVINVALGGTLITDIPNQFSTTLIHQNSSANGRDYHAHDVKVEENTRLAKILNKLTIPVNSFHHQAILEPAPGLRVTARATDGLIEAVEFTNGSPNLIGVQWHPECIQKYSEQRNLFKSFIETCGG